MKRSKLSVVLDTNVIVSAIIRPKAVCAKILDLVSEKRIEILYSEETLDELTRTLKYPKLGIANVKNHIFLIREAGRKVHPTKTYNDCRDPDDNKFLECALEANADIIITGDKDLLILHPWHNIDILSPRVFLELYIKK